MAELNEDIVAIFEIVEDLLPMAFGNKRIGAAAIQCSVVDTNRSVLEIFTEHFAPAGFGPLVRQLDRASRIASKKHSRLRRLRIHAEHRTEKYQDCDDRISHLSELVDHFAVDPHVVELEAADVFHNVAVSDTIECAVSDLYVVDRRFVESLNVDAVFAFAAR